MSRRDQLRCTLFAELERVDAEARAVACDATLQALGYRIPAEGYAGRFFAALWRAEGLAMKPMLARATGFRSGSAISSSLFRAGLPGTCHLRTGALLVRAAAMLEVPHASITAISHVLRCSSPNAFIRTIRGSTGMSGAAWATWMRSAPNAGRRALDSFIRGHVALHREAWRQFGPKDVGPALAITPSLSREYRELLRAKYGEVAA